MPEWAWALLIGGVVLGLIGVLYRHHDRRMEKYEQRLEKLEDRPHNGYPALLERVNRIERELGDRSSGIRGLLHEHSNFHVENDGRFVRLEEKLSMPEWVRQRRRRDD